MNAGLEKMNFRVYKTYRLYDRADMKALVTGGTGFVGSHLIDRLLAARARGHGAGALARQGGGARGARASGWCGATSTTRRRSARRCGDRTWCTTWPRSWRRRTRRVLPGQPRGHGQHRARHGAARALCPPGARELAGRRRAGRARGAPHGGTRRGPVTMYGRSKLAAEQVVRQSHLPWVIARPPAVYGPRDSDNFLQVFKLVRSGFAPVFGDGSQELSMVYAPDLARSLELIGTYAGHRGPRLLHQPSRDRHHPRPRAPHRQAHGPRRARSSPSRSRQRRCCSAPPGRSPHCSATGRSCAPTRRTTSSRPAGPAIPRS